VAQLASPVDNLDERWRSTQVFSTHRRPTEGRLRQLAIAATPLKPRFSGLETPGKGCTIQPPSVSRSIRLREPFTARIARVADEGMFSRGNISSQLLLSPTSRFGSPARSGRMEGLRSPCRLRFVRRSPEPFCSGVSSRIHRLGPYLVPSCSRDRNRCGNNCRRTMPASATRELEKNGLPRSAWRVLDPVVSACLRCALQSVVSAGGLWLEVLPHRIIGSDLLAYQGFCRWRRRSRGVGQRPFRRHSASWPTRRPCDHGQSRR